MMFDPMLAPKTSFVVKLTGSIDSEVGTWARANCRSRWNSSMMMCIITECVYFWFHDEFDCDRFRLRFGGSLIA